MAGCGDSKLAKGHVVVMACSKGWVTAGCGDCKLVKGQVVVTVS